MTTTFVTVVRPPKPDRDLLAKTVALLARATRCTFAWIYQKDLPAAEVKRRACHEFGLLARHWSGCRATAQGNARAWRRGGLDRLATLRARLAQLLESWPKDSEEPRKRHRNAVARRKAETRIARLTKELEGPPRWCFGGRELLRRAHVAEWRRRRDAVALFVGERGRRAGNEVAQWHAGQLRLRLPHGFGAPYLFLDGVTFKPAQQALLAAAVERRTPVSWRVKVLRRGKVQLCVTLEEPEPAIASDPARGAVAVDLNRDHVAAVEVSADGRVAGASRIPLARTSDAVWRVAKKLTARAVEAGRILVLEHLDLRQKKAWLRSYSARYAEVLSTFRSRQVQEAVEREARRSGVEVRYVDPAWTTELGKLKYKVRCRLGGHCAASLVIGRRGLGFGERLPEDGPSTLTCTVEYVSTSGSSRALVQRLPSAWPKAGRRRSQRRVRVRGTPAAGKRSP